MKELTFYIVDVFAVEKYTGNQLAIFTNASTLSEEQMQQLAKEMNYSETTFITSTDCTMGGMMSAFLHPTKNCPLRDTRR
jgi:trans-2,3-dihydro-3-hydroxyanthranilate isomerase